MLVLSQFAGAADQMQEALIVNPHDPASLASAIRRAIEMPLGERRARHRALWSRVADEDVGWWRQRFLATLAKAAGKSGAGTRGAGAMTISRAADYEKRSNRTSG
jgi:trehalose 6-phosphate synthase